MTDRDPIIRAGFEVEARAFLASPGPTRLDALRAQLAVLALRSLHEHNGYDYVEVTLGRDVRASGNSSCCCRIMSSDPDPVELEEHDEALDTDAASMLGTISDEAWSAVFYNATTIRFLNDEARSYVVVD